MTITMYGIKNCDTVKKARVWIEGKGLTYGFHDYRVDGLDRATLVRWRDALGWEKLLNKSSTTFRELPEADRAQLDAEKATALMLAQPTMIKRPVLDVDGRLMVGFKADAYEQAFPGAR
ncbi:ArsC family reductase [Rhizobiaceae sp. 2RAB30]